MQHDPLESFTRQIAAWADELIQHGRYPFRKVEASSRVLTPSGPAHPDLVLWINQASCMAGGVLFLPRGSASKHYPHYANTALSLGLQHFIVWDSHAVEIRSALPPFDQQTELRFDSTSSADDFRDLLTSLLDQLKPLAITGAVSPDDLSAWYLANLCTMTVTSAKPFILDATRRFRDETKALAPEARMENRAWHTLFHLLTLASYDLLPETVHAERLERAMEIATVSLPEHLQQSCQWVDPAPLPEEVAVDFHHLFRRLTQIGWHTNRARAAATLELLLPESEVSSGTLSAPGSTPDDAGEDSLHINPPLADATRSHLLLAPPGRLPGLALHRELLQLPPLKHASTSAYRILRSSEDHITALAGNFTSAYYDEGLPYEELLLRLRVSWPNRRFRPPRNTPRWMLVLLHLLGLCREGAPVSIDTPDSWPQSPHGRFLLDTLVSTFSLDEVILKPEGLHLNMTRSSSPLNPTSVVLPDATRTLEAGWLQEMPASGLALSLYLPKEGWELLIQDELSFPDDREFAPELQTGVVRFIHSAWGRMLGRAIGIHFDGKDERSLYEEAITLLPLPPQALLKQLIDIALDTPGEQKLQTLVDRELQQWFATPLPESDIVLREPGSRSKRITPERKRQLAEEVFSDGLPRFPEHYLYDHYRPELEEFSLPGPLFFRKRFFNQIELATRDNQQVIAGNDLSAQALLLASHGGRDRVMIPADESILEDILSRYRSDLHRLKEVLQSQCNALFENPAQGRSLARKIWLQQGLPPWENIDIHF